MKPAVVWVVPSAVVGVGAGGVVEVASVLGSDAVSAAVPVVSAEAAAGAVVAVVGEATVSEGVGEVWSAPHAHRTTARAAIRVAVR